MDNVKLSALLGSLRKTSHNTAVISALSELAASPIEIITGQIGDLPLFNPDRQSEQIPALDALKWSLKECSGLIIAIPEHARGISGPSKNALD